MSVLIVYYSLTGTARTVATALARELGAELEEIRCNRFAPGLRGFLRACHESWVGKLPTIAPLQHVPSRFDLVVLGGPIWAWHASTPVRAFMRQEGPYIRSLALFLTHGGSAGERAIHELTQRWGREPVATLLVREAQVKSGAYGAALASFAAKLRERDAA